MSFDLRELPDGWIQEFDPQTKHPFWVDTRTNPPRSIWVHPYEDEQFLREHPHIRERIARGGLARPNSDAPPAYSPRRHSFSGSPGPSGSSNLAPPIADTRPTSQPGTPGEKGLFGGRHHQGFMDKLKNRMHQSGPSYGGTGYGGGYGQPSYQQAYGPSSQQYRPSYGAPAGAPSSSSFRRYAPLLGGMGAGFLLGEVLDGPGLFGGHGLFDSGHGGFGGGGFGGGGFGGGGFGGDGFGGGGFGGDGFGGGGFGGDGFGGGGFDNFGGGGF
ncbi:hypothetical protein DAEQUDRAFT_754839 [Daedalea quercina L-15889]|uniref:WW domain-containing protein n=1 Tax=Daedalea quercina L-15889 TaxID=1314783 RepID=A0A165T103_9APHY|nr:hypothetical protein DAEQUDRAFT_754839 [Daedalea quercina L-15889]